MPQHITHSAASLVAAANAAVETIPATDAVALLADPSVVFVDIRDPRELEREGRIPGAFHCPRGMLEFWIDPASPYHKPIFAEDKRFVFFCGSAWRSALATKVAQDMGLKPVAHIAGGFTAWKAAHGPVDTTPKPAKGTA
jgi:rhodanese-related sulfurtransferase